ncbi:MAG: HisA/HisF-related TIM barrel protein [Thermaurantimonas sp.]|uniref:1-(5-phosphoribosyl)-5-[(5- phosphoribosylamino)methylideneamino]imidazole-4- carboxamide isomerase n=1 Tax=Thermaurantimonas sp. TaxID=2681568 RepID=UPI00391B6D48
MSSTFEIIPAIDLIDGRCVRLQQGDFTTATAYADDPLQVALRFEEAGLSRLHMVDLDGARSGAPQHLHILESIAARTKMVIDYGGGISSREALQSVFDAGARYVSVSSVAVRQPEQLAEWMELYGASRFFIGADVRSDRIAISGWKETTAIGIQDFIGFWSSKSASYFFSTDVERDGMLTGPSSELYRNILAKYPHIRLIASGGVRSVDDLILLKEIGCSGAIIGKALYEGLLSLIDLKRLILQIF